MAWLSPLPLRLQPTTDSESFRVFPAGVTGLPLAPHPGAFGVPRKHDIHTGVDLYAPEGTRVFAVEAGEVLAIQPFTGAAVGQPWWRDTLGVWVQGASGVVLYGEVDPLPGLRAGDRVDAGEHLGWVSRVLRHDKGRPTAMLHIELQSPGQVAAPTWALGEAPPAFLLDPTEKLLEYFL